MAWRHKLLLRATPSLRAMASLVDRVVHSHLGMNVHTMQTSVVAAALTFPDLLHLQEACKGTVACRLLSRRGVMLVSATEAVLTVTVSMITFFTVTFSTVAVSAVTFSTVTFLKFAFSTVTFSTITLRRLPFRWLPFDS